MKKLILLLSVAFISGSGIAQSVKEEMKQNVNVAGSNYLAYPGPQKALTAAPEGKTPFYISHYGRHGSRYLLKPFDYKSPLMRLTEAYEKGKLTALGVDVMHRLEAMEAESNNRCGELTPLGARQHKEIANRMFNRFPEVFEGNVHVDGKSTTVIRCILSMENFLHELISLNPKLEITHDASKHDMYYMNLDDRQTFASRFSGETKEKREAWEKQHVDTSRLMSSLFNDEEYISLYISNNELTNQLFNLASVVQNSEIRHNMTLWDIFTEDEIYTLWQKYNIGWFSEYGTSTWNGGTQPYSQRNLLKMIIHEADSCINIDRPGATLRFGHETMVMPLTCLLNLNGYGNTMDPTEAENNGWINYKIFPMAANVQFVFYRNNPQDKEVWVKVLLNEEEATLPLKAVSGPYYRWDDVRQYYLKKIKDYEDALPPIENNKEKVVD